MAIVYDKPDVDGLLSEWFNKNLARKIYSIYSGPVATADSKIECLAQFLVIARTFVKIIFGTKKMKTIEWSNDFNSKSDLEGSIYISPYPAIYPFLGSVPDDEPIRDLSADERFAMVAWSAIHESAEMLYHSNKDLFRSVKEAANFYKVREDFLFPVVNVVGDLFINKKVTTAWPGILIFKNFAYHHFFSNDIDELLRKFALSETEGDSKTTTEERFSIIFDPLVALLKLETPSVDITNERLRYFVLKARTIAAEENLHNRIKGSVELLRDMMGDAAESVPEGRPKFVEKREGNNVTLPLEAAAKVKKQVSKIVETQASSAAKEKSESKGGSRTKESPYTLVKLIEGAPAKEFLTGREKTESELQLDKWIITMLDVKGNDIDGTDDLRHDLIYAKKAAMGKSGRLMWRNKRLRRSSVVSAAGVDVSVPRVYRLAYNDPRVLTTVSRTKPENVDLLMVVDCSGSMGGGNGPMKKYRQARIAALALYELLLQTKVVLPYVYTHYTGAKTAVIHRIATPDNYKFASQINAFESIFAQGANADGIAAAAIFKDFFSMSRSSQRICFWVADGQPSADSYSGEAAVIHTKDAIQCGKKDMTVYGVFILSSVGDTIKAIDRPGVENAIEIFGARNLFIFNSPDSFIQQVVERLNMDAR